MIGFLPEIYPDELVYSWLARYYCRTGYAAYIDAIVDFYEKRTARPDVEFINRLNKETKEIIMDVEPMEKLLLDHTMFPYYGRFLNVERRKGAFASMIQQEGDAHNLLAIPVNREGGIRYVRYCPVCVGFAGIP
nr:TniQ family protein [uncultured Schaedlerella sp.]